MPDPVAEALRKTPLFSSLSESDLSRVAALSSLRRFAKRDPVFRQGDRADGFYVVAKGKVKVSKLSEEGKEQVLHIVEAPHSFAEATLFEGGSYPADAEAIAECEIVLVPKKPFLELIESHPKVAIRMLGSLSRWLRRMADLVESLSLRDVEARLVGFVGEEMRARGIPLRDGAIFELPVGKNVLASRLGTVPETFSRTLRKLQEEGTIQVKGKQIRIVRSDRFFRPLAGS